jgi:hypothetical protein
MMPKEARGTRVITLAVSCPTLAHVPPIGNGTFVKCTYDEGPALYKTLGYHDYRKTQPDERLLMGQAGVGSVIGHDFYLCPLELGHAQMKPPTFDTLTGLNSPAKLDDVWMHMWYCVAFRKGLFWVRYDWLRVVSVEDVT